MTANRRRWRRFLAVLPVVGLLAAGARGLAAGPAPLVITFKIVKKESGTSTTAPSVRIVTHSDRWRVRDQRTWSGENEREIVFTIEADRADSPMPRVAVAAPGVEPTRVIVGKTDVAFERAGETVLFEVVRDTRNAMLIDQVLPDPEGGVPIHVYHNWAIRQDGPYRGKPYPETETRAVLNYLVAAREALKLMGSMGPRDQRRFDGDVTLMSFEVACARGHNDAPPHVHIMLWVPGYVGSEIPHFYMDAAGKMVRNRFDIIGDAAGSHPERAPLVERKRDRAGDYGPGRACRLLDLEGRTALELTITPEGGLLVGRGDGETPYLLVGDSVGAGQAVLVRRGGEVLARARVVDDASRGIMSVEIDRPGRTGEGRTLKQALRYDPFTGLGRTP